MTWIRRQLYTFGYWLGAKANTYQERPLDPTATWWDVSVSFEGSQQEAEKILDLLCESACGNPKCGDFGEHCKRDWAGGSRRLHTVRLAPSSDWDDGFNVNTNPTTGSFNYTSSGTT